MYIINGKSDASRDDARKGDGGEGDRHTVYRVYYSLEYNLLMWKTELGVIKTPYPFTISNNTFIIIFPLFFFCFLI